MDAYITFDGQRIKGLDDIKYVDDHEETPVMGQPYDPPPTSFDTKTIFNKDPGPCYLCNNGTKNYLEHKNGGSTRICLKCINEYLLAYVG